MTDENQPIDESRENRIRRLIYRSMYTGTKETDTLLGEFARDVLPSLDDAVLDDYETLLDFGDPTIWAWVSGQSMPPANISNLALDHLITWCQSRS
jgi:antitoxin CptB